MKKNIKILATVGPASIRKSVIERMDAAGADIFRINLSHTKVGDFMAVLKKVRLATSKTICLDSEGAQIRTGRMKNGRLFIKSNNTVFFITSKRTGDEKNIPLYPIKPQDFLKIGDVLHIDFHNVIVQVISIKNKKVQGTVLRGGFVGSNKGVSVDRVIELPPFTEKDLKVFNMARKAKINQIALSFASRGKDIKELRKIFQYPIFVISKIESRSGIKNLKEIAKKSNALLIDRGDLSRDVPLPKIALVQRHILSICKKLRKPVYVATNLLETMTKDDQPTRAEINDITSTLLSGADGLVLAAETAIGKNPAESVKMIQSIISEVKRYNSDKNYFNSIYDNNLIEPHGGVLVQNHIQESQIKNIKKLPKATVPQTAVLDVIQIAEGVYSPLEGFMTYQELLSVLDNYRLPNGVAWTMPILLQFAKEKINFKEGKKILLQEESDKEIFALMEISEIKKINLKEISQKWFGTTDINHPGVSYFISRGDYIVAGKVHLIKKPSSFVRFLHLNPKQTRETFTNFGWRKIVGFHTRNVVHKGHEFIQKEALKKTEADALFISPVIGPKKKNDFTAKVIISAYELMIRDKYYNPYPALIGPFATYSRYSGPREAVFTALCRKNFGCSHFVVGRDHTGVGNFYKPNASQEIFRKIGDIGIIPLFFDEVYHCYGCQGVTTKCDHPKGQRVKISGTKARECLLKGQKIPNYLIRKKIADMLFKMHKSQKEKLFEV